MAGTIQTLRVGGVPSGYPAEIDATVKVRFVDDSEIVNLSDLSTDFLKLLGGLSGKTFDKETIEWTEDDTWTRRPTLSSVGDMVGGAQDGNLDDMNVTGQAHRYPIGTVFVNHSKSDELVRVESHTDADNLNVRRGYAGSSVNASDWAATDDIMVAGFTMQEDDNWAYRPSYVLSLPFNYTQIQHTALRQSWHRAGLRLYGTGSGANDFANQVARAMAEQFVAIEQNLIDGLRFVGNSTEPAMAGGLDFFINAAGSGAQITDLTSNPLTRKDIEDLVQAGAYAVGRQNTANLIVCDYWFDRKLRDFYDAKERVTSDQKVAGLDLDAIRIPGLGMLTVLPHTAVPEGHAYFIKLEHIQTGVFAGLGQPHVGEIIQNDGPTQGRYFYTDWSAEFKGMEGFGLIHKYSVTS